MILTIKRKGSIILIFWLFSLILMSTFGLCANKTILTDNKNDLYRFTNEQLNEITDTRIEPENEITVNILNNVFNDLINSRNIATKVSNPSKMDITDIEIDNNDLSLVMNSENLVLDDMEALIGFIWNSKTVLIVFMLLDTYLYIDITSMAFDDIVLEDFIEIEVSDNRFILNDISDNFDKSNYVKGFLVYTDLNNPNSNTIEMFTTQIIINWNFIWLLFWIIIIIALVIIVIVAVIIIANR